jgi:two-component system, NarL family, sensor kinase
MSATGVSVVQPPRTARSPVRDPLSAHLLTVGVVAVLAFLLIRGSDALVQSLQTQWPALLFWTALVFVVNLFPIQVGELRLTLDVPILLAVAFLYSGEVGAAVAVLGAVDLRELRREVGFSRAIFNRGQVALSILVAGNAFHWSVDGLEPWTAAIGGTALALALEYTVNVSLVSLFSLFLPAYAARGSKITRALSVGEPRQFLATYLGYGVLALVLAYLFVRVGSWSVVFFLIPTLVARQMLIRGQDLERMAEELRYSERLLERLVDRGVDERHDERLRIASDLHDDVLQELTRVWYLAKILEHQRPEPSGLQELVQGSEASIESLRRVIHDLKESPLGRGGLVPTLRLLARDLQIDWKTRVSVKVPSLLDLDPQRQVLAYQVIREAILNALKHARAPEVRVEVVQRMDAVELAVEDDGVGFDTHTVDQVSHFGLGLMSQRIDRAGGTLVIQSKQHKGTRLIATIPREPRPGESRPTSD